MIIKIIAKTNAKENSIKYDENYKSYRVSVKAKPIEGKANIEIEKFLSKHFNKKAKITSGFKVNKKLVRLE